ncbi:unnamed protein product [Ectocarpus sp. CCAP 1310/34]|nr:unnamed protein product [Ectocarpus sp. CCAP 1310/34]
MLRGTTSRLALRLTPEFRRQLATGMVISFDNHQHRFLSCSSEAADDANRQLGGTVRATRRAFATKKEIGKGLEEEEIRPGDRSQVHFRATPTKHPLGMGLPKNSSGEKGKKEKEWSMPHGIWSAEEVNSIKPTHKDPEEAVDHIALRGVRALRWCFDVLAGFKTGVIDEHKCASTTVQLKFSSEFLRSRNPRVNPSRADLNRVIFLETVAGIPGMVAGTLRHLTSLRRMRRDHGWIHTLLEEAENERMHLLTFLKLKQPGPVFRFAVMISQGVMYNAFFLSYLISPKACHRFVGYIEEEAVHTYTVLLEDIDANKLPLFSNLPAPAMAKSYWKLGDDAMFRDLVLAVRADEANHCVVNHTFADMHQEFKEDAVSYKHATNAHPPLPALAIGALPLLVSPLLSCFDQANQCGTEPSAYGSPFVHWIISLLFAALKALEEERPVRIILLTVLPFRQETPARGSLYHGRSLRVSLIFSTRLRSQHASLVWYVLSPGLMFSTSVARGIHYALSAQVNPFSIHANVTKYADVGVTPPTVADMTSGNADDIAAGNANGRSADVNPASSQPQPQKPHP